MANPNHQSLAYGDYCDKLRKRAADKIVEEAAEAKQRAAAAEEAGAPTRPLLN
jgi:hypothetical protein